jgi:hypothetical protein
MNFHVGQKVVCIGMDDADAEEFDLLEERAVYTIRDIDYRAAAWHDGVPTVRLEEVTLQSVFTFLGPWEEGFHPGNFRPLRVTNIDVFLKMLEPQPKEKVEIT